MYTNVIKYALHYDLIVNYSSNDFITTRLIDFYLEVIKENTNYKRLSKIDFIIGEYFKNDDFNNYFIEHINDYNIHDYGIDYFYDLENILIDSYEKFKRNFKKEVIITKWL